MQSTTPTRSPRRSRRSNPWFGASRIIFVTGVADYSALFESARSRADRDVCSRCIIILVARSSIASRYLLVRARPAYIAILRTDGRKPATDLRIS